MRFNVRHPLISPIIILNIEFHIYILGRLFRKQYNTWYVNCITFIIKYIQIIIETSAPISRQNAHSHFLQFLNYITVHSDDITLANTYPKNTPEGIPPYRIVHHTFLLSYPNVSTKGKYTTTKRSLSCTSDGSTQIIRPCDSQYKQTQNHSHILI
ncbi:unnamed protein product [Paramecium sonneborni]|uniref:Uncharacterized protein n=1 Tax=Paramecium sonneborni TaxID=65129 RepID=A0A8S1RM50_9CILI|nr:unnamed protein product [Paramecium sonneborni]